VADDPQQVSQDEIENLLKQAQSGDAAPPPAEPSEPPSQDQGALGQDDIEAMMSAARGDATTTTAAKPPAPSAQPAAKDAPAGHGDVDLLLQQAEQALASIDQPNESAADDVQPFELRTFAGSAPSSEKATLDLIRDVELDLKIELGRTQMHLEDILELRKGSVVPLDKMAGDPVDVYVNGRLIARGEVLVLNDNFCVRVAELISGTAVD